MRRGSNGIKYYDWRKTLSYDAPITVVITARGEGKTYGLRKQSIKDWINHKWRYAELCRWSTEIPVVRKNYFDKLQKDSEFKDYEFKTDNACGYIRKKKTKKWNILFYFIALTQQTVIKKATFVDVNRIIFDEAILEKRDRFHDYLPDEMETIGNCIDSCVRDRGDGTKIKGKLYCLANAVDIVNPIFEWLRINTEPNRGYTWYKNKLVLLHYEYNPEYIKSKSRTLSARILEGSISGKEATENIFDKTGDEIVAKKTSNAKFECALKYFNACYAIWIDYDNGYYYVNKQVPKNQKVLSLNLKDSGLNAIILKRSNPILKALFEALRVGIVKFDTLATHHDFIKMLDMLGYH